MRKIIFVSVLIFIISGSLFINNNAQAASLASRLSGRILLDVNGNGEAWYVNPADERRYYLGRPADAFRIMRELAIGITNVNLAKIESASGPRVAGVVESAIASVSSTTVAAQTASTASTSPYDANLTKKLAGNILLQVEDNGEAWYVNPTDQKKYYLGRPADAFRIMRELSLGISKEDLAFIHKPGFNESIDQYSKYERKTITIASGATFKVDVVEIDLADPNLKIITDTANDYNCKTNCAAKSLVRYAVDNNAFAAINATYFDTSAAKKNYYFYPVYNSNTGKLINEDQLKYWTTGPIMVFDTNNKFYYFKDSREFKSVADFESTYGAKIQAALGNKPRLIEKKMNLLIEWDMDEKQLTAKAPRNALAYIGENALGGTGKVYLVIAYDATVTELADVMKAMNVDYALNLDGGYSTALIYNGEYMAGPGRDIPNALLFGKK